MLKKILSVPYILLTVIMFVVFAIDSITDGTLTNMGAVGVRDTEMLHGVLFYSFLHGNIQHIMGNLTPFLFFGWFISKSIDKGDFYLMWLFITITSGLCIWLFGAPNSHHIGASGVVFGMWSLLLTLALKRRSYKDILIGLIVIFAYGWTFVFGLVPTTGISFAGHFWGVVFGIIYGLILIKNEKYEKKNDNTKK